MIPQPYPLFVRDPADADVRDLLVVGWEKHPDGGYNPVVVIPDPTVTAPAFCLDGDFNFAGIRR